MPDWANYYRGYTTIPTVTQLQQEYEEYRQRVELEEPQYQLTSDFVRQFEEEMRRMEESIQRVKELEEDKRKYPLFFLKEGIV